MAKGPFMEFLRAYLDMSAANAYTEMQIPTPSSKTETMAMLIHSIELVLGSLTDPTTPADGDQMQAHLADSSQTQIRKIDNSDVLTHIRSTLVLNAVVNAIEIAGTEFMTFDPPILYPKANLYLAAFSTGFTSPGNVSLRIGYTLEKVSREDFISALVE